MANMEGKVTVEVKKVGPIRKVRNWWKGLSNDQQWAIVTGVWFVDGLLIGSAIKEAKVGKRLEAAESVGAVKGYTLGQIDAYKEMAKNPYQMMDAGMKKLEQQGKAKRF